MWPSNLKSRAGGSAAPALASALLCLLLAACASAPPPLPPAAAPTPAPSRQAASTAPADAAQPAAVAATDAESAPEAAPDEAPLQAPAAAPPAAPHWPAALAEFTAAPRFRHASWGVHVAALDSGRTVFAHAADTLFIPASVTKVATAALALRELGGAQRFRTRLLTTAPAPRGQTLNGDLILQGGGDPSLGQAGVAPGSAAWATQLADAVVRLGVQRIEGDLVADDTLFAGPPFGSGWEAGDLAARWAPPVSSLVSGGGSVTLEVRRDGARCCSIRTRPAGLERDIVNLTAATPPGNGPLRLHRRPGDAAIVVTGSLPAGRAVERYTQAAPDPARLALLELRNALSARGVTHVGRTRVVHAPEQAVGSSGPLTVLTHLESPPLRDLVRHTLQRSDNSYAQILLLQSGLAATRRATCGDRAALPAETEAWGLCALRALLRDAGIDTPAEADFSEGSGLSRHNLVTPAALTRLLRWAHAEPWADDLVSALPTPGAGGTLRWRLADLPPGVRVRAKTGGLAHVYTLAGYIELPDRRQYAFSVMLNRYQRPRDALGRPLRPSPAQDIDALLRRIITALENGA